MHWVEVLFSPRATKVRIIRSARPPTAVSFLER